MAVRSDIAIDWFRSPRLITVLAPSTEVTVQDLLDTLRQAEDEPVNMVHPKLIDAAGKEALGGGVTVGITATLNNARVLFESRKIPQESGTVTTGDTTGVSLIDSTALFQTNGVTEGAWVRNCADGSAATVLRVISEIELEVDVLGGGTDNQFDIGDDYAITNTAQCSISGGNLVAIDDVGGDIEAVFPTVSTQVVRTSSSSATIQELESIQHSSYEGGVWVDVTTSNTGINFPVGTHQAPVNNMIDAETISEERGFNNFYIIGDITVDSGGDFSGHAFFGQGVAVSTITIDPGADVDNCTFEAATITGTLDGDSTLSRCNIRTLNFVNGMIINCMLEGGYTITLGGTATAHFLDCYSGVPGLDTPVINCGGSGQPLGIRGYSGGIELENKTGADDVSIDLQSGQIILDSTVTNGTIVCRGVGKLTDNSTGSAVVVSDNLIQTDNQLAIELITKILRNRTITDPTNGEIRVYDDDNSTLLLSANLYEDKDGLVDYQGQGAERRDRLE